MLKYLDFSRIGSFKLLLFVLWFITAQVLVSMFFSQPALSAQATIAWNPNATQVAGYKVYYGQSSGKYTNTLNVGNNTSATLQNLSSSNYFIAVTAYDNNNNESGFSQELAIDPLSASAGQGGTVKPSGTFFVARGSSQTFSINPSSGYKIADVKVDGQSVGAVSSYTFTGISDQHTIAASFASTTTTGGNVIVAMAGSNGSISPSGTVTVSPGASQTFSITPATGYRIQSVLVDGFQVGAISSYTFSNVTTNHAIFAIFTSNITSATGTSSPASSTDTANASVTTSQTLTITPTAGANGTISPSTAVKVNYGGSQTFTITPAAGYRVAAVQVDGTQVGAVTSYVFSNVTSSHTISASFETAGQPPVADAGPDQNVPAGATVTLNGSNSTDANGPGISSYLWTQTGGTKVAISNPQAANTTFSAPYGGTGALTFNLRVTDSNGLQSNSTCIVNVISSDMPPTANAGPDQTVAGYTIVTLDGSKSSDPSNGISSYQWQQMDGPAVTISGRTSSQATFVAPQMLTGNTSMSFMLTVTNNYGLKSTDLQLVNVAQTGQPPQAVAGPNQTVNAGSTVKLDGSNSTAPQGMAKFRWHQTGGAPVTLSDPTSPTPTFTASYGGQYGNTLTFRLIVEDKTGMRSKATEVIVVK